MSPIIFRPFFFADHPYHRLFKIRALKLGFLKKTVTLKCHLGFALPDLCYVFRHLVSHRARDIVWMRYLEPDRSGTKKIFSMWII